MTDRSAAADRANARIDEIPPLAAGRQRSKLTGDLAP